MPPEGVAGGFVVARGVSETAARREGVLKGRFCTFVVDCVDVLMTLVFPPLITLNCGLVTLAPDFIVKCGVCGAGVELTLKFAGADGFEGVAKGKSRFCTVLVMLARVEAAVERVDRLVAVLGVSSTAHKLASQFSLSPTAAN